MAISVRCPTSVLNVQAKRTEGVENVLDVAVEAVGEGGCDQVRAIGSDRPYEIDHAKTYEKFCNVECIFGDAMHVLFKIEKAPGSVVKALCAKLKPCLYKFTGVTSNHQVKYERDSCQHLAGSLRGAVTDWIHLDLQPVLMG